MNNEAVTAAISAINKKLGDISDLPTELQNTIANIYYNVALIAKNPMHALNIFPDTKASFSLKETSFYMSSAKALPELINEYRVSLSEGDSIKAQYINQLCIDMFKYRINVLRTPKILMNFMRFIRRNKRNEIPGFYLTLRQNSQSFDHALNRLSDFYNDCHQYLNHYNATDKFTLAKHLYLLGAVDCSSQITKLTELQFVDLAMAFFRILNTEDNYTYIIMRFFPNMQTNPSAMNCVIEGGRHFREWTAGKREIAKSSYETINKYCTDSEFPESAAHLFVLTDDE